MAAMFSLEVVGFRDELGRFARKSEKLKTAQREMVRGAGREYINIARWYAPNKTGVFAGGIMYRTDEKPQGTSLTVYVKGEHAFLLDIIRYGSEAHEIPTGGSAAQMAKGYPLHWIDEKTGENRFAWSVWHPGTQPNDFIERAQDSVRPIVMDALHAVGREVIFS